jgi:hypothetical protein
MDPLLLSLMGLDGLVLGLELFGPVWNPGKMRYKYGNIPTKYGIPQIQTEKLRFYFRSHSDNLRPVSEPIPDFFENTKMDGSNVEKRTVRTGKNSIHFQH